MSIFDQTYPDALTSVFQAVINDNVEQLETLKADGRSMRIVDNQGMQPLHHAVIHCSEKSLDYLLKSGEVEPDCQRHDGSTPLLCLLRESREKIGKQLEVIDQIAPFADFNLANLEGVAPIHIAGEKCDLALLEKLLNKGNADPYAKDANESTVLHYVAQCKDVDEQKQIDCAKYLLGRFPGLKSIRNSNELLPFMEAIIGCRETLVLELLKGITPEDINRPTKFLTPLAIASGKGMSRIVNVLLAVGAKPNSESILLACSSHEEGQVVNFPAIVEALSRVTDLHSFKGLFNQAVGCDPFRECVDSQSWKSLAILIKKYGANAGAYKCNDSFASMGYKYQNVLSYILMQDVRNEEALSIIRLIMEDTRVDEDLDHLVVSPLVAFARFRKFDSHRDLILSELLKGGARISRKEVRWVTLYGNPCALARMIKYAAFHPEAMVEVLLEFESFNRKDVNLLNRLYFIRFLVNQTIGDVAQLSAKIDQALRSFGRPPVKEVVNLKVDHTSLEFWARRNLRQKLLAKSVTLNLKSHPAIKDALPQPLITYALNFPDLDLSKCDEAYLSCKSKFSLDYL